MTRPLSEDSRSCALCGERPAEYVFGKVPRAYCRRHFEEISPKRLERRRRHRKPEDFVAERMAMMKAQCDELQKAKDDLDRVFEDAMVCAANKILRMSFRQRLSFLFFGRGRI